MPLELEKVLDWFEFPRNALQLAGLREEDLQKIYESHCANTEELKKVGLSIADGLRGIREVHSVNYRPKDPESLVAKIVRKKLKQPALEITPHNYSEHFTDLIGVRVLHLFKDHWPRIHKFIKEKWDLHEQPKAFYRLGDPTEAFEKRKLEPVKHDDGYRSLHYIVKDACLAEVQVRTVFEEGWSQIDHHFRYARNKSHNKNHLIYDPYLLVFNHFARTADEMATLLLKIRMQLRRGIFGRQIIGVLKRDIESLAVDVSKKKLLMNHVASLEQALIFSGAEGTVPLGYLYITPDIFPTQLNWTNPDLRELDPLLDQDPEDG